MKKLISCSVREQMRYTKDELKSRLSCEGPEAERLIRVYLDRKGAQLYISFTNFTAVKKRSKTGGRFQTTKGEGHGFGLVRMDAIIERLGGYLTRNSEDGAFTTEILLPVG